MRGILRTCCYTKYYYLQHPAIVQGGMTWIFLRPTEYIRDYPDHALKRSGGLDNELLC